MAANAQIPTLDGQAAFPAYVARPAGTPRGAIIVVQEIFGINPGIRQKADDWATAGYLAVAPDIFWRQQPGVDLDPDLRFDPREHVGDEVRDRLLHGGDNTGDLGDHLPNLFQLLFTVTW